VLLLLLFGELLLGNVTCNGNCGALGGGGFGVNERLLLLGRLGNGTPSPVCAGVNGGVLLLLGNKLGGKPPPPPPGGGGVLTLGS